MSESSEEREPTEAELLQFMHSDTRQTYEMAEMSAPQRKQLRDGEVKLWKEAQKRERERIRQERQTATSQPEPPHAEPEPPKPEPPQVPNTIDVSNATRNSELVEFWTPRSDQQKTQESEPAKSGPPDPQRPPTPEPPPGRFV